MLAEAKEEIDDATENSPLRANSKRKAATWYAEKRPATIWRSSGKQLIQATV